MIMLDIETTGLSIEDDDILQIAMLEMRKDSDGLYFPGALYSTYLHSDKTPSNKFAVEHMAPMYELCNRLEPRPFSTVKAEIKKFLVDVGHGNMALMCGKNAATFDLPFLVEKGLLSPSKRCEDGSFQGDFHYRTYDLGAALFLAQDVFGEKDRGALEKVATVAGAHFKLPEGLKAHDAVYDVFMQAKMLNGLIQFMRD